MLFFFHIQEKKMFLIYNDVLVEVVLDVGTFMIQNGTIREDQEQFLGSYLGFATFIFKTKGKESIVMVR